MRVAEKAVTLGLDSNPGHVRIPGSPVRPPSAKCGNPEISARPTAHRSLTTVVSLYSLSAPIALMDTPPHKKQKVSDFVEAKPAAWTDSDDANLQVSLSTDNRRRKLRDALLEDTVDGRDYERRLRRQFEKINPTPEWATNARSRVRGSATEKRSRISTDSEAEEEEDREGEGDPDSLNTLLAGTGSVVATRRAKILAQGTLAIERLRDANLSAKADGEVKVVQFHPSPQVPVCLVASSDRRLRLFNVRTVSSSHLSVRLNPHTSSRSTGIPILTSRPYMFPLFHSRMPPSTRVALLFS